MINAGDQLVNPVTGERLIFHETSKSTNGEYVLVETIVEPGGAVAAAHVHPHQTERFEVVEGKLGMKAGRKKLELGPGESVKVEPGTAHKFWNAGETEVRFVCEIRPAQQFEQLIETMFSLAADGKTNRKGMPNLVRLAVIANHHFDDVRLPFPPAPLQKLGLVLGAPVGRMVGYRETYAPAGTATPAPVTA
jgi:mannose-6-phosphate isomerase-like protein (cupin superfamily)